MVGTLEHRDLPAEERLALYNAANQGYDTLTAGKQNGNGEGHHIDLPIIPVPPPGHGPPTPVNRHHSNHMGQFALPPRVEEPPTLQAVAEPLSPKEAQQEKEESEANTVFKTPPAARYMPVIKLGSQRNTDKFNRLTAFFSQNPSLISHNPLRGR